MWATCRCGCPAPSSCWRRSTRTLARSRSAGDSSTASVRLRQGVGSQSTPFPRSCPPLFPTPIFFGMLAFCRRVHNRVGEAAAASAGAVPSLPTPSPFPPNPSPCRPNPSPSPFPPQPVSLFP
eukprot:365331-Chlamydomonas_euryale.AAC.5